MGRFLYTLVPKPFSFSKALILLEFEVNKHEWSVRTPVEGRSIACKQLLTFSPIVPTNGCFGGSTGFLFREL